MTRNVIGADMSTDDESERGSGNIRVENQKDPLLEKVKSRLLKILYLNVLGEETKITSDFIGKLFNFFFQFYFKIF